MARSIVLIPHLYRLADANKVRKDYSPPSSPPSRLFKPTASGRTPPIGRPGPKCCFLLRPRVSNRGLIGSCLPLFSDWHGQYRLEPSDRGFPLGRDQGERRKRRTKSKHGTRTIPCMPAGTVLLNRPNTNSIVGTDICVYSIVGADIYVYSIVGAVGAPIWQKGPPHASRHR